MDALCGGADETGICRTAGFTHDMDAGGVAGNDCDACSGADDCGRIDAYVGNDIELDASI